MEGEVIGIVVLDAVDEVRPFDEAQQALAEAVADQLALFIQKRVLLERPRAC